MIRLVQTHFFLLFATLGFIGLSSIEIKAQAPTSIAGRAVILTITSGTAPFASSGSYRFLASAIDNSYGVIGISGVQDSYGTFTYSHTTPTGTVNFNDSGIGVPAVSVLTFSTSTSGTFITTIPSVPGASQTGTFTAYNGQGPSSIQGWIFNIQVDYGTYPFATTGSSGQLLPATTGNTYQIIGISGVSNSSGTYTYSLVSQSASSLLFDDSLLGPSYTQTLSWQTATSGAYVARNSTGVQAGTFTAVPALTVTPSAGANGSISPNTAQIVSSGGSVGFTATPNNGYAVYQWLVNGSVAQTGGTNYTASDVTANATVQVTFQAVATIAVSSSPSNGGIATGGGIFAVGISQTVTATANQGYAFSDWTENGSVVSTSANYNFIVSASLMLVANFAALSPPIITSASAATFAVGQAGTYTVTATGNPSPTFSATGIPSWASLNPTTGVLSGTPPNTTGTPFTINLTASNGNAPDATKVLTLNVQPPQSFSQWETFYSTGGPSTIPLNDGVSNLLKYLYNINPLTHMSNSDRVALSTVGMAASGGVDYLTLTYRQYALETGLTINVQTSLDLQTWTILTNPTIVQIGTDSNTGDPIMQVQVAITGSNQFIRLNVTQP